ncbi:oligoendopeptidase F [Marispirochaeta sp.]|uniref:oligoendopeptidase F n=1 Tax=Marispirochaeta sp. TaxID=2038653 RepID=UPI0029C6C73A|nr:oligoendopeptidase F [Marispirochaeta sp.]
MSYTIPKREEIDEAYTWDLGGLFTSPREWEESLKEFTGQIKKIESFQETLGDSAEHLAEVLDVLMRHEELGECLGSYAYLRTAEDGGSDEHQARYARFMRAATESNSAMSYFRPEILAIPDSVMQEFLKNPRVTEYRIMLNKMLRFKPHTLGEKEERLLSMQSEANQTASGSFKALTDVDLDFGEIETKDGKKPLTQSTFSAFLMNPDRQLRETAYRQFYGHYEAHKNTLASLYSGSVHLDIYKAKVRKYPSSRAAALFPDKVDEEVYDNLIAVIHENLPILHRYYSLRKKKLGIDKLRHWDVYVPLTPSIDVRHSYAEAVETIIPALSPLGDEYCETLKGGLLDRWVDRYENKGKRSGAFSAGSYHGEPYILMNYKDDVFRDVFTLAHEGGHSMHSWYSVRNNPFQHYDYTIFEAEVASTFNEQLLGKYLMGKAESVEMKAYLVGKQIDEIVATIFRQTMFAEFEHMVHKMGEEGTPLTLDSLRSAYRSLMEAYFGPEMILEEVSDLEGLRIPHFYRAFYVYKYATGLSAAIALADRVLTGGTKEREDYLSFLKSGGSRYPLESLQIAGVDMSTPEPVRNAMKRFEGLVDNLGQLQ